MASLAFASSMFYWFKCVQRFEFVLNFPEAKNTIITFNRVKVDILYAL